MYRYWNQCTGSPRGTRRRKLSIQDQHGPGKGVLIFDMFGKTMTRKTAAEDPRNIQRVPLPASQIGNEITATTPLKVRHGSSAGSQTTVEGAEMGIQGHGGVRRDWGIVGRLLAGRLHRLGRVIGVGFRSRHHRHTCTYQKTNLDQYT